MIPDNKSNIKIPGFKYLINRRLYISSWTISVSSILPNYSPSSLPSNVIGPPVNIDQWIRLTPIDRHKYLDQELLIYLNSYISFNHSLLVIVNKIVPVQCFLIDTYNMEPIRLIEVKEKVMLFRSHSKWRMFRVQLCVMDEVFDNYWSGISVDKFTV